MENSDDSEFDDLEDLGAGPDLSLEEKPGYLLDHLHARQESGEETLSVDARSPSPHGNDTA